jgi:hypothetical protein
LRPSTIWNQQLSGEAVVARARTSIQVAENPHREDIETHLDRLYAKTIANDDHDPVKILANGDESHGQAEIAPMKDGLIVTPKTTTPIVTRDPTTGENDEIGPPMILKTNEEVQDESASTDTALSPETTKIIPTAATARGHHQLKSAGLAPAVSRNHLLPSPLQ